jgi:hypothetical protein
LAYIGEAFLCYLTYSCYACAIVTTNLLFKDIRRNHKEMVIPREDLFILVHKSLRAKVWTLSIHSMKFQH